MFPREVPLARFLPRRDTRRRTTSAIIDEEGKVRARTPQVSKFRDAPFDFSTTTSVASIYVRVVEQTGRSRGDNVAAFFRATFEAWRDYRQSGNEKVVRGLQPGHRR